MSQKCWDIISKRYNQGKNNLLLKEADHPIIIFIRKWKLVIEKNNFNNNNKRFNSLTTGRHKSVLILALGLWHHMAQTSLSAAGHWQWCLILISNHRECRVCDVNTLLSGAKPQHLLILPAPHGRHCAATIKLSHIIRKWWFPIVTLKFKITWNAFWRLEI